MTKTRAGRRLGAQGRLPDAAASRGLCAEEQRCGAVGRGEDTTLIVSVVWRLCARQERAPNEGEVLGPWVWFVALMQ